MATGVYPVRLVALATAADQRYDVDAEKLLAPFRRMMAELLGLWGIPAFVAAHTLPCAVFFEADASLPFGFLQSVICVFFAKVLDASLSFWIGREVLRGSRSAKDWAQCSKYFHLLARIVERDDVSFLVDFHLPTVIGCLPMILQNVFIGSPAGAAVASESRGSKNSQISAYLFPHLGILSNILRSLRIKRYSSGFAAAEEPRPNKNS